MQVNHYLPQPVIAARFTGVPYNRPASIQEVIALLQSYGFRAWEAGRPAFPQELAGTLSSGWKLIAFVRSTNGPVGHFIVLQGLDPMSGGIITSDPWTGQTLLNSIHQLYYSWHWIDSIVVGAPG